MSRRLIANYILVLLLASHPQFSTPLQDCSTISSAPVVQQVSPSTLPWIGGSIVISGRNLQRIVKVQVGSKTCSHLQHSSSQSISCIVQPTEEQRARMGFVASTCEQTTQHWIRFEGWMEKEGWRWRAEEGKADVPSARSGHSLTADGKGRLLVFGGITETGSTSDLHMYDGKWRRIVAKTSPAPRSEHVAWFYGDSLYILGGWYNADWEKKNINPIPSANRTGGTESIVYDDLHRYDLAAGLWRAFPQLSGSPPRRRGACAVRASENLYLFGGLDDVGTSADPKDDALYFLALSTMQWSRLAKNGKASPPPLAYAAMVVWTDGTGQPCLMLFGGLQSRMQLANELWSYNLKSRSWHQLFPSSPVLPLSSFVGRQMHAMIPFQDRLFIFGGQSVKASRASCAIFHVLTGKWKDESCLFDASSICRLPVRNSSAVGAPSSSRSSSPSSPSASCFQLELTGGKLLSGVNVSGTYRATGEQLEGRLVYKKVDLNFEIGDTTTVIFYWASYWVVGPAVIPYQLKQLQLVMEPSQVGSSFLYASSMAYSPVEATGWNEIDPLTKMWQISPSIGFRCSSPLSCSGIIFQQECWHLVKEKKVYDGARSHCERLGGKLAGVHSRLENDFVSTFLRQTLSSDPYVWIGLHRNATWQWEDGTRFTFSSWAYGEPDGRGWAQPSAAAVYQEQAWFVRQSAASSQLELLPASPWCGPALSVVQAAAAMANGSLFVFGGMEDSKFSSSLHKFDALSAEEMFCWEPTMMDVRPHVSLAPQQTLTILGRGLCHPNMSATIGGRPCTRTKSLSSSLLECDIPLGVGANLPLELHNHPFHLVASQQRLVFNYTPPSITAVQPTQGSTAGGEILTVWGKYFGQEGDVRDVYVGGKTCTHMTWGQESVAKCRVPANSDGGKVLVKVIVGGQVSAWDGYVYAVEVPRLISVHPSTGPAAGGHLITVQGENLDLLESVMLNNTVCSITMQTPTTVTCLVGPLIGRGWRVKGLDSRGRQASGGDLAYDVEPPLVTGFLALHPAAGGSYPTQGTDIVIVGRNFGTTRTRARVVIGSTDTSSSYWVDDSMINCRVPAGAGSQLEVRVDVAEQHASIAAGLSFSYNPPAVGLVKPDRLVWDEEQLVTMLGSSFGGPGENVSIFIRSPRGFLRLPAASRNDSMLTFQLRPWLDGVVRPPARYQTNAQLSFAVKVANQVGMTKVWLVAASSNLTVTMRGTHSSAGVLASSLSSWASVEADVVPPSDVHVRTIRRNVLTNLSLGRQNFSLAPAGVYSVRFLSSAEDHTSGERRFRRAVNEIRGCCLEQSCDADRGECNLLCRSSACKTFSPLVPFLCTIPYSPSSPAGPQHTPTKNSSREESLRPVQMELNEGFTTRWVLPTASVSSLLMIVLLIGYVILRYEQQYQKEAQSEEVDVESGSSSSSDADEFDLFDLEEDTSQSSRNIEMAVLSEDVAGKEGTEMQEMSSLSKGNQASQHAAGQPQILCLSPPTDPATEDEEDGNTQEQQDYLMLTIPKPKAPLRPPPQEDNLQPSSPDASTRSPSQQDEVTGGGRAAGARGEHTRGEERKSESRTLTSRMNARLGNIAQKIRGLDVRGSAHARYDSLGTTDEPDELEQESDSQESDDQDSERSLLEEEEQSDDEDQGGSP